MPLSLGLPYPLGATLYEDGVNFAVASDHAHAVDLCIFDATGHERAYPLLGPDCGVWHGFLAQATPGLRYGFRAHGPHVPEHAQRFNPHKLLLDPYAREVVGRFEWDDRQYGYVRGRGPREHWLDSFDTRDNADIMLMARVAAPLPGPAPIGVHVPAAEMILYEVHIKGFSKLHPAVPEALRGTYAGLAHPACIEHFCTLGITTLSLLPVHYRLSERHLSELGLSNYWGYNTIAWFCPDPRLSSTPNNPATTRTEFRAMVAALHAAGLEVVLDVVFNHTAEAGEFGPTLSLRGLDESLYYRHEPNPPRRNINWTGCGNTLDFSQARVIQLVLDSLRYWVMQMGVDGFRFDLAPILGRAGHGFETTAPLFVAIAQDPILARVKLIAEPWDLGPDGYQLGRFPRRWQEWNDRYRDGVRRFWLRAGLDDGVDRAEFAKRLAGSSDRFAPDNRAPSASVNFVAAHDGFTLADMVSYSRKHNLANGENNRDGHDHNFSNNCGVEGPTDDPQVLRLRDDLARALLTTLFVSQGTPMLLAGDELGRSQRGNNNAYCQDNRISWIDWSDIDEALLEFTQRLIALRRRHPALRQDRWLGGHWRPDSGRAVQWRRPDGAPMRVDDWHHPARHGLMVRLGDPEDSLLVLFNPERVALEFELPEGSWTVLLCSKKPCANPELRMIVAPHAVVILGPS